MNSDISRIPTTTAGIAREATMKSELLRLRSRYVSQEVNAMYAITASVMTMLACASICPMLALPLYVVFVITLRDRASR